MDKWITVKSTFFAEGGNSDFEAFIDIKKVCAITKWCEYDEYNITLFLDGAGDITLNYETEKERDDWFAKLQRECKVCAAH